MSKLRSVGWVCVRGRRILVARTRGRDAFYLPGGKIEPGETDAGALIREVREELSLALDPTALAPCGVFIGPAHGYDPPVELHMACFRADHAGPVAPSSEVEEIRWLAAAEAACCAPVARRVVEHLHASGLID